MQPRSLPRAARSRPLRAQTTTQTTMHSLLAVPGFGSSASVAVAGAGGGWWNSADTVGGAHGGVGPGADDDIVPGFGGGSEVPGLGSGGGGFGGGGGSG